MSKPQFILRILNVFFTIVDNIMIYLRVFIYNSIKIAYYQWRYGICAPGRHDIIWVDPNQVQYVLSGTSMGWSRYGIYLTPGQWDKIRSNPEEAATTYHKGDTPIHYDSYQYYLDVQKHYEENVPWPNLAIYNETSATQLENTEKLVKNIREHGYLTQSKLYESPDIAYSLPKKPFISPKYNEVCVCISRNGELIQTKNGRHRLIIAKILDLHRIPVRVIARHEKWQEKRCRWLKSDEVPEIYNEHPDIQLNPTYH